MGKEKRVLTQAEKKRRKKIIRNLIILAILVVVIGFCALACSSASGTTINPVTTIQPQIGNVEEMVSTNGTVESEETKVYFAPVSGRLSEVCVQPGEVVQAGDLLIAYDMEQMAESLKQAELQYAAGSSSYNGSLAGSKDAQTKLNEANINIPVLEQQIKDEEACIKQLSDRLTTIKTDTANSLAAENMNLQKQLIELQKDPVGNADAITNVQLAMQTNQYLSTIAGTSGAQADLQKAIETEQEKLAGYQEYLAEMENQQKQAEAEILNSYQKENLSATEQMNLLTYENVLADYNTAQAGITAEFEGIVTEVGAIEGMTVGEGTQLLTLENSNEICIVFSVTKYDLARIAIGQKADITISGNVYEGTITRIDRMATMSDSGNAAVGAGIHLENPDENVYLGLDAKIEIHAGVAENALLIPVSALNADKAGDFVFVEENGLAVRKDIVTGISSTEYIEVKEGLSETDKVIVSSALALEEGMAVYGMPEMAIE